MTIHTWPSEGPEFAFKGGFRPGGSIGTGFEREWATSKRRDPPNTPTLYRDTSTMKRFFSIFTLVLLSVSASFAQSNVSTQEVSINVEEIDVISIAGTVKMTINAATAGEAPDAAQASATFSVTTNGKNRKISAELDQDMPEGLTLYANMSAPEDARSKGKVELGSRSKSLVDKVSNVNASGLSLAYEAVATVDADPENVVRTVTYTITKN